MNAFDVLIFLSLWKLKEVVIAKRHCEAVYILAVDLWDI